MTAQCFECGYPSEHLHHVVPKSRGGKKTIPLCALCHSLVHETNLLKLSQERKRERARQGKLTSGLVPYGYKKLSDGTLVKDDHESEGVALARKMRSEGCKFDVIGKRLFELGFTTRKGTRLQATQIVRLIVRDEEALK